MVRPMTVFTEVVVHGASLLSLWTNGCVVSSLARYSPLRKSNDNLYLGAMATVNMIFNVYAMFMHVIYDFQLVKSYTNCGILNASFLAVQEFSLLIVLVATINCFLAIRFPFSYSARYTKGVVVGSLGLAAAVAVVMSIIVFTVGDMYPVWKSLGPRAFCLMKFSEDFMLHYYVFFMCGIIVPLCIMCAIYIYLFVVVRRMSSQVGPESSVPAGNASTKGSSSKSKAAAQRFSLIVCVYILCMFPMSVMNSLQVWPGWYCGLSCKQFVALLRQVKPLADSFVFTYKNRALRKAALATARCKSVDIHDLMAGSDAARVTTK